MPVQTLSTPDGIFTAQITGVMTPADLDQLQRAAAAWITTHDHPSFLIIATHFAGWSPGDWNDIAFRLKFDRQIKRIAIVSDPRWTDEILMFVGQGLRRVDIQHFAPANLSGARQWLLEPAPA
jgi:hypothetical protein